MSHHIHLHPNPHPHLPLIRKETKGVCYNDANSYVEFNRTSLYSSNAFNDDKSYGELVYE